MKLFPNKSVLTLAISSVLVPNIHASQLDSRGHDVDGGQRVTVVKQSKRDVEDLYVVLLKEAPLSSYRGDNRKFAATSLKMNPANRNDETGLLDMNSSASRAYISHLQSTQQQVLSNANVMLNREVKAETSYQVVLNGFTTRLNNKKEVTKLQQHDQVSAVIKVTPSYLTTDSGPSYIKAPSAWNGSAIGTKSQGEGVIVGIMDTGINPSHPSFADISGDGYDHTNPRGEGNYLGDCRKSDLAKYCNDKLIGIWGDEGIINKDTPAGQDKIAVDYDGHGSHTASTTAGNVVKNVPVYNVVGDKADYQFEQISGVAPRANIVSYQVCEASGSCWPDITAKAVEHAIANGIKVINYSVGGTARNPWESIDAKAFLSAREAGIHVATSAGNSGPGPETVGSPGNAPWVTTVAAYTHDRSFTDKKVSFSGGDTNLADINGKGATKAYTGKVVDAKNFGDGQCLNPFAENTFDGQIVICERGEIARVAKGKNVLAGGAGGMIFMNAAGGSDTVDADLHVLPAIHVTAEDGKKIKDWLATGADHQATIGSSDLIKDPKLADKAAPFTSRGPDSVFNRWMTPHVAAPGVDIYAANSENQPHKAPKDRRESPYIFLSGTSMSSPHVAGALTLIHSMKPGWTPAEAQSALMLTAVFDTKKEDGVTPSGFFDGGSGSIRIDKALKSGLVMDVTHDEYVAANPDKDGKPETLNMPAMLETGCLIRCTWTRTFKATETASWTTSHHKITDGVSVSASPASFSLAKGETIELTITAEIGEGFDSDYGFGRLVLTPDNIELSTAALPVIGTFVAGSFPEKPRLETSSTKGSGTIDGIKTIPTQDLQIATFELAEVENIAVELPRDDSDKSKWPINVYNDPKFYYSKRIDIHNKVKHLVARIKSTTSPDLDMYIGKDSNLNGKPDNANELHANNRLCMSATETQFESCVINNPKPGSYFFAVHNFGDPDAPSDKSDEVVIEVVLIGADDNSIKVTAPDAIKSEDPFAINVAWDKPLKRDTLYMTALEMGSGINTPTNIGIMPIEIYRNANLVGGSLNTNVAKTGDTLTATIDVAGNNTDKERTLNIKLALPQGITVSSDSHNGQFESQQLIWELTQAANSTDETITVELGTAALVKSKKLSFELSHTLAEETISEMIGKVDLSGVTLAKINGEDAVTVNANEKTNITLAATGSSVPEADDTISYEWKQSSGPDVKISDSSTKEITVSLPDVASDAQVVLELTVSNGTLMDTATATINVKAEKAPAPKPDNKSSGGSMDLLTLMLGLLAMRRRIIK
ncbi:S8 family serine peptidase [Parashewanella tropica]|uniref:S8 family serine peptidase n=1 Tax=Parashewanella tropica TaxID=2547970 RepID=UPI001478335E|nr:S8 family serine peptidase [Parashewanella tropica]